MQRLIEGFRRFRETYYEDNKDVFDALAREGQSPRAMVIACCDSRVDPGLIFDTGPGEVFVVRNVANLVPPYAPDSAYHGTSAALEFAVKGLKVEHIIVLGHSSCGGVRALMENAPVESTDFINQWMEIARPARENALAAASNREEAQALCEHETIKVSLANLMTFPWIVERVRERRLSLHGWYYDIDGAQLHWFDRTTSRFKSM